MRTGLTFIVALAALGSTSCAHNTTRATESSAPAEATRGFDVDDASAAAFAQTAGDRIYFAYDQASLSAEARQVLQRQAAWLQQHSTIQVLIAGHCDERGTREYNLALGARRAAAARDYLVTLGVAPARLQTISYGKDRPLDTRANPEGWAVNRNAHTQVTAAAVG